MKRSIQGTSIDTVWFQCPWATKRSTAGLIQQYLNAAARVGQIRNILLGVTTIQNWRQHYHLEETIINFARTPQSQFVLRGKDIDTTCLLYGYGYRHTSVSGSLICNLRISEFMSGPYAHLIELNTEILWFRRVKAAT
eukprot:m51a1_g12525 hypothetical protein (138) ;mRNA; r:1071-1484